MSTRSARRGPCSTDRSASAACRRGTGAFDERISWIAFVIGAVPIGGSGRRAHGPGPVFAIPFEKRRYSFCLLVHEIEVVGNDRAEVGVLRHVGRRLSGKGDRTYREREPSHDDGGHDQASSHLLLLFLTAGLPASILPHREDGRHAQKGRDEAASDAASRIGCTTKKDPTVTTTHAAIAVPSAESRGGEPPATARRSSVPVRMYIQRTTLR